LRYAASKETNICNLKGSLPGLETKNLLSCLPQGYYAIWQTNKNGKMIDLQKKMSDLSYKSKV
jgi:hypothetical protein